MRGTGARGVTPHPYRLAPIPPARSTPLPTSLRAGIRRCRRTKGCASQAPPGNGGLAPHRATVRRSPDRVRPTTAVRRQHVWSGQDARGPGRRLCGYPQSRAGGCADARRCDDKQALRSRVRFWGAGGLAPHRATVRRSPDRVRRPTAVRRQHAWSGRKAASPVPGGGTKASRRAAQCRIVAPSEDRSAT